MHAAHLNRMKNNAPSNSGSKLISSISGMGGLAAAIALVARPSGRRTAPAGRRETHESRDGEQQP